MLRQLLLKGTLSLALLSVVIDVGAAEVIELKPGLTILLNLKRIAQTVVIGDPLVANAKHITLNSVAVTGKSIGATNLILLDEAGMKFFDVWLQVVDGSDFLESNKFKRREVRVRIPGKGAGDHTTMRYFCGAGCSYVPHLDRPAAQE